jgi:hypothetical protein
MATVPKDEIARIGSIWGLRDVDVGIQLGGNIFSDGRPVRDAIRELHKTKPYLFKTAREMSREEQDAFFREAERGASRHPPAPASKSAKDMTEVERQAWWKAHRAAHR